MTTCAEVGFNRASTVWSMRLQQERRRPPRPRDLSFSLVRDHAGFVIGALAIARDCTERYMPGSGNPTMTQ